LTQVWAHPRKPWAALTADLDTASAPHRPISIWDHSKSQLKFDLIVYDYRPEKVKLSPIAENSSQDTPFGYHAENLGFRENAKKIAELTAKQPLKR